MAIQLSTRRLGACGLLCVVLAACGPKEPAPRAPLLLIGIDGVEPAIAATLLDEGRLPELQRFVDEGVVGSLGTMLPTWSPVIWTTIATGRNMRDHGVTDFLEPTTELPFTSNTRRVPALWNLVSDAGLRVDCAGWWVSWPAEEVNGRIVSSYAAQAQAHLIWKPTLWGSMPGQTWPLELEAEIAPFVQTAEQGSEAIDELWQSFERPEVIDDFTGRLVNDLAWTFRGDNTYTNVAKHFLQNEPGDLVMAYLSVPDVAGHRFWRYYRPEDFSYPVDPALVEAYGDFIEQSYVETFRRAAELIALAPEGTNVLIVSDHGMHADLETLDDPEALTSGHHQSGPSGLFAARGPAIAARGSLFGGASNERGTVGDVRGVAPFALYLLDLPVPKTWDYGKRANPMMDLVDADWLAAHPLKSGPDPDPAWLSEHPPTQPIDPGGEVSDVFVEAFTSLGYIEED